MKLFIRYLLLAAAAIALGMVPAYLYHQMEAGNDEYFYSDQWRQVGVGPDQPALAILGDATHDFGLIEKGKEHTCEFVIENRGTAPLEIWREATESIIRSDLGPDKVTIAAGSSYPVSFRFNGDQMSGEFNESVEIGSNDKTNGNEVFSFKLSGRTR